MLTSNIYPAQAFLNSTSQLLARDRRVVAQAAELGPGDLRMARGFYCEPQVARAFEFFG